jgi:hypothetical protein
MIDFLLQQIYNFINFILGIFPPAVPIPQGVTDAFSLFADYWASFDVIAPMTTMLSILTIVFGVEITVALIRFTKWVIKLIPGIG